jgi:hypothetical protein
MIGAPLPGPKRPPSRWYAIASSGVGILFFILMVSREQYKLVHHTPSTVWWGAIISGFVWGAFLCRVSYVRQQFGPAFLKKSKLKNSIFYLFSTVLISMFSASTSRYAWEMMSFINYEQTIYSNEVFTVTGTFRSSRGGGRGFYAKLGDSDRQIRFQTTEAMRQFAKGTVKDGSADICFYAEVEEGRWGVLRVTKKYIEETEIFQCMPDK